jgi:hypothetical protein
LQVIFIGDAEQVEKFRKMQAEHERNVRDKVEARSLPASAACSGPTEDGRPADAPGGESKRLAVESPWSRFTGKCQRF